MEGALDAGESPAAQARAASFDSVLEGFWAKNESTLQGIVRNPPVFYHCYPNVDVPVASFSSPAKAVPSLLHHRLEDARSSNESFAAEIVKRLREAASNHCVFFVGGKGCGKSRTLYEVLAKNFGFYFVASKVENGESKDFNAIVETLKLCYPAHNQATELIPRRVGVDAALCALLARLIVFSKVLEEKPEISPLEWLICQTECRPRDLFRELTFFIIKQELPGTFLEEKFSARTEEVYEKIKDRVDGSSGKLLFVVDDALSSLKNRFRSDNQPAKLKSLLSQTVKAIRTQKMVPTACILAGTAGDLLAEAQEMESPVYTEDTPLTYEIIDARETFESPSSFTAFSEYVSGFLGPGDYKCLFQRFYQSRAGTIASALHHYINKRTPRGKALEFLDDFALTLATKGGLQLSMRNSIHDTLMSVRGDRYLGNILRDVTEAFYLGGKGYCFTHNSAIKLVDLGIAVLKLGSCDGDPLEVTTREAPINRDTVKWNYAAYALVTERLIQAALCYIFVPKVKEEIFHRYEGLLSESERNSHFEKYCAAYVLELFNRDEPLEKLFRVDPCTSNAPPPQLQRMNAPRRRFNADFPLVERYLSYDDTGGMKEQVLELVKATVKLPSPQAGTPLMVRLGQKWTFEKWLEQGRDRPTFLQTKTDNQFGPDFIAILEMSKLNKEILLGVQVREGMSADRLDARQFFAHNKIRQVLERNTQNSSLLSKIWSTGWLELRISPTKKIEHDNKPFPVDKPCIRAHIDKTNLYTIFPKLLNHLRVKRRSFQV